MPDPEMRLQHLGLFCSVFTISMYLSPLADLVSGGVRGGKGDKSPTEETVAFGPEEGKTRILEGDRAVGLGEWEAGGKGWVTEDHGGCLTFFFEEILGKVGDLPCAWLGVSFILSHRPRSFVLNQPSVSPFHSPLPPSSPLPPGHSMGFD